MSRLSDIIYESGEYFITRVPKGFEVYKQGVTSATKVATIHYLGDKGLERAKYEIEKRKKNPGRGGRVGNPETTYHPEDEGKVKNIVSRAKDGLWYIYRYAGRDAVGNFVRRPSGTGYKLRSQALKVMRMQNPGESADSISKGFHGRPVGERFEVEEEELYPDNLAVLGCLVELVIQCKDGMKIPIRGFKNPYSPGYREGDEVFVTAPDRHNIIFAGGDQEVVNADKIAEFTDKLLVRLGKVTSIAYLTDKHHLVGSNGKDEEFEHEFGKKKYLLFGKKVGQPDLMYDTLNKTMSLAGGTYTITDEGIRD